MFVWVVSSQKITDCPTGFVRPAFLRNLTDDARFSIFHDLGPDVAMCHLDGVGATAASEAVERDIAAGGCELILLNKFGKLEAAGDGLAGAFRAALAARLPLLTSISPAHDGAWRQFTDADFAVVPADPDAIDLWRRALLGSAEGSRDCAEQRAF
jgi:hypothetical protein